MKMLSVEVDDSLAKTIDRGIRQTRLYSSRSEFLKDAIRKNLAAMYSMDEGLRRIHSAFDELAAESKALGAKHSQPSRAQRVKIAKEYLKEKGFSTKNL